MQCPQCELELPRKLSFSWSLAAGRGWILAGPWRLIGATGCSRLSSSARPVSLHRAGSPSVVAQTCRLLRPSSISENAAWSLVRSCPSSFLVCPYAVFPSWGVSRTPGECRHDGEGMSAPHQGRCRGATRSGPRARCCPPSGIPIADAADTARSKLATHSGVIELTTH
jgi:hypothetical protein